MARKIFVNLPTKDLEKSKHFFVQLGFTINPQFSDEKAACVVISEDIYAMILQEPFFRTFTGSKEISDARNTTEVLVALSTESRQEVDDLTGRALSAGGREARPAQDHGFMYTRSFEDPDGHIWELFWMDPANVQPAS